MYSSAIDLGSGALGGVVTVILGQPMDTVKVSCMFFFFMNKQCGKLFATGQNAIE